MKRTILLVISLSATATATSLIDSHADINIDLRVDNTHNYVYTQRLNTHNPFIYPVLHKALGFP
jgi:hypothetical protein